MDPRDGRATVQQVYDSRRFSAYTFTVTETYSQYCNVTTNHTYTGTTTNTHDNTTSSIMVIHSEEPTPETTSPALISSIVTNFFSEMPTPSGGVRELRNDSRKRKGKTPSAQTTEHQNTMGDENPESKERKKRIKSNWYSEMSIFDAQKRLGFRLGAITVIPVETMLAKAKHRLEEGDATLKITKESVYDRIVEYLEVEGYPEISDNFKEANINDLVYTTVTPIIADFKRNTGHHNVKIQREKHTIPTDSERDEDEEFVVTIDEIYVTEEKFILIVETKRLYLAEALKQCLLAMKDMGNRIDIYGGEVYGFVTTGETWRMLRYDGTSFEKTECIDVLRGKRDRCLWMENHSILVDCMYVALSSGGIVKHEG
ncbi:hypothetical protein BDZ91DRAFT_745830 [Kalaharituber pfeilii]|nr:hypothetical protein BDZ91DRAFT_745830 [Kalaharituber pfeilii]